jgi:hypothetical protein
MKKVLLIAAVAVFGFSNMNAQEVSFGVKAGTNFSTITGDDTDGLKTRVGFHVGGVAEIMFNEKIGIQPELLFSSVGAKYKESYDILDVNVEATSVTVLNYLTLPIMGKYFVTDGVSLEFGPQLGILLSANEDYEVSGGGESESGDEDIKDYVTPLDFGLNIGAGYKFDNGLNFAARYYFGLSNINDFSDDVDSDFNVDDYNNHNAGFQISVGYMF